MVQQKKRIPKEPVFNLKFFSFFISTYFDHHILQEVVPTTINTYQYPQTQNSKEIALLYYFYFITIVKDYYLPEYVLRRSSKLELK